ncbi:Aste57867_18441 [Aphanomyces stellatus]|uniref:Aste57867_18441 protein n=1 Tax=Aphanomyces stellatus TaxID=120398 RepID=A0A485LBQ4_9STRA|nr:hypothetical protein As57867_018379 [Aphanomyces stellatus]VFT95177.1 Aste57867_18441 [Aphanomyces stellatus]
MASSSARTAAANRWKGSAADYAQMDSLSALLSGQVLNQHVDMTWSDADTRLCFLRDVVGGTDNEVHVIDTRTGARMVDNARLKAVLAAHVTATRGPDALPTSLAFQSAEVVQDGAVLRLRLRAAAGHLPAFRVHLGGYVVEDEEETSNDDANASSILPAIVSESGGGDTHVQFRNGCAFVLDVFWVDTIGKEHQYMDLAPGASVGQHTYAGHVWRFKQGRKTIAWHRAEAASQEVHVQGVDCVTVAPFQPVASENDDDAPSAAAEASANMQFNVHNDGIQLTTDGCADAYYADMTTSPNGDYIACFKVVQPSTPTRHVTVVEHCPKDGSIHPHVRTHEYAKPGDPLPQYLPRVIHIKSKTIVKVDSSLCATPYSSTHLTWHPSSEWFSFLYNPRGHQCLRLLAVHALTGAVRVLLDETSPTFVFHTKHYMRFLAATNELLWTSEQSGYRHLYLYYVPMQFDDIEALVGFGLTHGNYVVRKVVEVNETSREILLAVSGQQREEDPYHVHYVRIHMDSDKVIQLTDADGTHEPLEFSPHDGSLYLARYSRVDLAPTVELRRTVDGSLVCQVDQADISSLLATGWCPPQRIAFPGRDNQTLIYGIAVFPLDYDHTTPLHVVEVIYAGPHGFHTPKAFGIDMEKQKLAELGFVVVQMDGMGTAGRSKAFHDVCHRNVLDSGLPDRKLWIESLAHVFPLDLTHGVGIYGGSAGGQNAVAALLQHGDLYSVAVADCGCHDNRVDKLWWNELWMGYPTTPEDDAAYVANSCATHAANLAPHQHLMLAVGMLDDNVDPACTFQLAQALMDADKDFDLLCFPKGGHGATGGKYGERKRHDYFVRHLQGREPRKTYIE